MIAQARTRLRGGLLAAAVAASAAILAPARAAEDADPFLLKVDPFKSGLEFWERTGAWDKAFTWAADGSTLTMKGAGGKEPPRIVYPKVAWDRFEVRFQVKKGLRKMRLVLRAAPPAGSKPGTPAGDPVAVEIPSAAARGGAWSDVVVRVGAGRAAVVLPEAAGEKEIAATALPATMPAGTRLRVGIEAPSGYDGAVTGFRLVRTYEDVPPVCEDGFTSLFNGTELGEWQAGQPEMANCFRVEKGLLIAEVRDQDWGWLTLPGRPVLNYELRFRAVWGSSYLEIRAVEVPGTGGQVRVLDNVQVNLSDSLEPEDYSDVTVRVETETCTITVNGKKVFDAKIKPDRGARPISFFVKKGKKALLRDVRLQELGN